MKKFCMLISLIVCLGCTDNKRNVYDKYKIFRPAYDLTYSQLLESGFEKQDVDVLLLSKKINDSTILQYYLNDHTTKIAIETWVIEYSKEIPFNEIESFVRSNRSLISSTYCPKEDTVSVFYVVSLGLDFKCVLYPTDSSKILRVEHKYPHYYDYYRDLERE